MKRAFAPATALLAVLATLVAVNVIGSLTLRGTKLDLTEEKLYTLSDGSRSLLQTLDGEIKLKLFYSDRAAAQVARLRQYADRVVELLKQYEAASAHLSLEILEPRPDTEVEEWALRYGMQPVNLLGTEDLYLGLVLLNDVGDEEVIPFLTPEREAFLEYDITKRISSLGTAERQRVGILSPFDVLGNADDPMVRFGQSPPVPAWAFASELSARYAVEKIDLDTATIAADLQLLVVIHPKELPEKTRYAIDQYVLGGGRALVFVDPLSRYDQGQFNSPDMNARFQARFDSNLPDLLRAWGVEMAADSVVADLNLATPVRAGREVVKHPTFLSLGAGECNQEEIVSSDMESLLFGHAGFLRVLEGEAKPDGLTVTSLIHTTEQAGEVDAMMLKIGGDPASLRRQVTPGDERRHLAVKISGRFRSAFPDGRPATGDDPADADVPDHRSESATETALIVVADTDLLSDEFSVRRQNFFGQALISLLNDNLLFALNAVENLTGAAELIGLRTRGRSDRPFTLVDRIEREAEQRWKGVEEELLQKQEETNRRLAELERGKAQEEQAVLSQSQLDAIQGFRAELAANKKKLREVRRNLRQDIERLGLKLKVINIALMPALVLLAGFAPLWWRTRRARGQG